MVEKTFDETVVKMQYGIKKTTPGLNTQMQTNRIKRKYWEQPDCDS